MYLRLFLLLFFNFLVFNCNSVKDENEYFCKLEREIFLENDNPKKVEQIHYRELEKYNTTKENKYLISSKYVEISVYSNINLEQIGKIYKLLQLNNNKYPFITSTCNYFLARKFERSLPKSSLSSINKAIEAEKTTKDKPQLSNYYHFKGRILYNMGYYKQSIFYYNKALEIYKKDKRILYIASMYNNIGMSYYKQGKTDLAIQETIKAINLISKKEKLENDESNFLHYIKGTLASYYKSKGEIKIAKDLLLEEWDYSIGVKNAELALLSARDLININNSLNIDNIAIINSLEKLRPQIKNPDHIVELDKIKWNYYSKKEDYPQYKIASENLIKSITEKNDYRTKELNLNFEVSNKSIYENFKSDYNLEKKKNHLLVVSLSFIIFVFLVIFYFLKVNRKKKIDMMEKDIIISKGEKKLLEESLKFKDEKIKDFQLFLNLKTETEKTFLESLKKIKKSKNNDTEETVKELFMNFNNITKLNKKGNYFINESSEENKAFISKLSDKYPFLSKNELKFCILFRLGLASKEIASLENISEASVRVYKTKIKTKIGLDRSINLTDFLKNI